MKTKCFLLAATLFATATLIGCDDDNDSSSSVPTKPTTFSPIDGAIITDTRIDLQASGSTIENGSVAYAFYLGTSKDNLEFVPGWADDLKLYTKYYWCVKVKNGDTFDSEEVQSDIFTFYCLPKEIIQLSTDNGENESAMSVYWEKNDKLTNLKLSLVPDKIDCKYNKNEITLLPDQTSFYVKPGNEYDTYTQDWDDKKGLYYEPIVYNVNLSADLAIGDTIIEVSKTVKEVFLNKSEQVRDEQFNVYRVKKIGNLTWMVDDFRYDDLNVQIFNDDPNYKYNISKSVTLKSGQKGVLYATAVDAYLSIGYINRALPKGFEIAKTEDWEDLFSYYGMSKPIWKHKNTNTSSFDFIKNYAVNYEALQEDGTTYNAMSTDTVSYQGQNANISNKLRSQYSWYSLVTNDEISGEPSEFNSRPWGAIYEKEYNTSINSAAFYYSYDRDVCIVGLWSENTGVCCTQCNMDASVSGLINGYGNMYLSVRGVKKN